jgi:hypothetical protein
MKQITISGTTTRYQIKKATDTFIKDKKRKITTKWNNDLYNIHYQKQWLSNIHKLNQTKCCNEVISTFPSKEEVLLKSEIEKKLSSYRHQDDMKKKSTILPLINFEETITKLIECDLSCYYCKETCFLFYEKVRDEKQWTLDRIDNDSGHNKDNVVICCLKCNLDRRKIASNSYLFTRQLVLRKLENETDLTETEKSEPNQGTLAEIL